MNDNTDIVIDYKKVGEKIRIEREKFGLSREEIAEKLNLSSTYIGQIERGDRRMRFDTYIKFARFFHVPTDYLLSFEELNTAFDDRVLEEELNQIVDLLKRCNLNEIKAIKSVLLTLLPIIHQK